MRDVLAVQITTTVRRLCIEANTTLGSDVVAAYEHGLQKEESPAGKESFLQLLENARIAREEGVPLCQDTGLAIVFMELGQDVHIVDGDMNEAIHEGVRQGYTDGFLRASSVDPISRQSSGDRPRAIIHTEIVPGDRIKLIVLPKGFGAEMMSRVMLFPPSVGLPGVKRFVVDRVEEAGPNACPPVVVGVGIGGNFEYAAFLAKKSLLRPLGQRHPLPDVARLETEILEEINSLGIGPLGLGGRITALDVHIETYPTHIASIPVAVNIQCHSHRHKEAMI